MMKSEIKIKQIIFILVALILSFVIEERIYKNTSAGSSETYKTEDNELFTEISAATEKFTGSKISEEIKYGAVYDITNNKVIWAENTDIKLYPASLTKLLTAYTALKYVPADTVFTVGSEQKLVKPHSSICLIEEGFKLTLYDLICGMLIASGNDAAYTIAVNTARFISDDELSDTEASETFCNLMNKTAEEISMNNSHFCNPDGWDDEEQYTTINDLMKLSLCTYNNNIIREISGLAVKRAFIASGETLIWKNTNEMLDSSSEYYCPYITGGKTGTTDKAGKCLIVNAEKCGCEYIAVVMKCNTDIQKYKSVINLLNITPDNENL